MRFWKWMIALTFQILICWYFVWPSARKIFGVFWRGRLARRRWGGGFISPFISLTFFFFKCYFTHFLWILRFAFKSEKQLQITLLKILKYYDNLLHLRISKVAISTLILGKFPLGHSISSCWEQENHILTYQNKYTKITLNT